MTSKKKNDKKVDDKNDVKKVDSKKVNDKQESWLETGKKSWRGLSQTGSWFVATISNFLRPPPTGLEYVSYIAFVEFITTVLVGIMVVLTRKWNKKSNTIPWTVVSVVLFLLSGVAWITYYHCLDAWTISYYGNKKIIGNEYTREAQNYIASHPGIQVGELLKDFTGDTERIWTMDSIGKRRTMLHIVYLLVVPVFTICIISMLQAVYCSKLRDPPTHKESKALENQSA